MTVLLLPLSFHYLFGSSAVSTSWTATAFFKMPTARHFQFKVKKNILASEQVLISHKNV